MFRNKLGFYIQISQGVHDWITAIKPPVILLHAWDQGLLEEIRRFRSPETFVIGRMDYIRIDGRQVPITDLTETWLTKGDPEAHGRLYAEHILEDNFQLARRAEGGHRLIDAWMSLNESVPGPGSDAYRKGTPKERKDIEDRLGAYDKFQFAFRNKLMEHGIEAVAFNFGAGNFGTADQYEDFFPLTLGTYTYLGFHEYGWPALSPELHPDAASSAGTYSPIVRELRQRKNRDYQVIITEAGLARLYKHSKETSAGDVGWLYPGETISQNDYRRSLEWYNTQLNQDDFVLGACLFQVGHEGKWESFRHIGQDNTGKPIEILPWIEGVVTASRETTPRAAVSRMGERVGLEANRPLHNSGHIAAQVADPRIISTTRVGWVRVNFVLGPWQSVRDQSRHADRTWEESYRTLIDGFRREGLKVYGLISHEAVKVPEHDLLSIFRGDPEGARNHPWIDRYVDTFVDILKMFGDSLTAVESFNEPDGWHDGRTLVQPQWFAIMLDRIYQEVRKHPEFDHLKLVSGPVEGTSANKNGGALNYLPEVYKFGKKQLDWGKPDQPFPFDGVGYHMYVEEDLNRSWPVHRKAIRNTYTLYLDQMRQAIRNGGDRVDKPLYISEMGWYTNKGPEDRQAECLPFALETLLTGPWHVDLAVVFCTQDFGDENTLKWYGLYPREALSEAGRKPAYEALRLFCQRGLNGGGMLEDAETPSGVSNQQVINAFATIIRAFGLTGWELMEQNGISLAELVKDRKRLYTEPDLATLPNLSAEQQAMLLEQLAGVLEAPRGVGGGFLISLPELTTAIEMLPRQFALSLSLAETSVERRVVRTWNRWNGLLGAIAAELEIDLATAVVVSALSSRHPASNREGRLHIRFDVHNFLLRSQVAEETLTRHFHVDPARPWQKQLWRSSPSTSWQKAHAGQDEEWAAFRLALDLDPDVACEATGMGVTGIMGFNHDLVGYASARQMLRSYSSSERMQVLGIFDLMATPGRNSQALWALQQGDLDTFAALQVGPEKAARLTADLSAAIAFYQRSDPLYAF